MHHRVLSCCLLAVVTSIPALAGPLSPPVGPVAATGRFGPRIEINQANTPGDADSLFKITQPGSYYLGGNLAGAANKHGIEIASSGVTLDLMGFDVKGFKPPPPLAGASLNGIHVSVPDAKNLRIHSGSVRNWGGDGVHAAQVINSLLSDLSAEGNAGDGLWGGIGGLIKDCTATANGNVGIRAGFGSTISGCAAFFNTGGDGIRGSFGCTIIGNTAMSNAANGIITAKGSTVSGNTVRTNGLNGISATTGCLVNANTALGNLGDEIIVTSACFVLNNTCGDGGSFGVSGAGIHATGARNRIEANNVTINERGIDVDGADNLIIRNSASANTVNYDIVANNKVGVIVNAPNSPAIIGSTGGVGVGTTNPWANFSY